MVNEEFFNDIRLNAIRNATFYQNETQVVSIPGWLRQLPEKMLNLSSQADTMKMEILATMNKPESPIHIFTFILSCLTIVFLILLVLLLCCWGCWRYFGFSSKSRCHQKYKTSQDVECKEEKMQNITNVNLVPSSKKLEEQRDSKVLERKVETESCEKIIIDRYDRPPRSGMSIRPPTDNYFPEDRCVKTSAIERECIEDNEYGFDKFEQKKTYYSPKDDKSTHQIIKESYAPLSIHNQDLVSKSQRSREAGYIFDDECFETRSYDIGRC
uniref:Uncharacterized protein n=1 Tax=Parastrongyloides trichosuri TaxID=131310 RepID=A0A0N4ZAZ0_PARTI